jgi:hypothetical protein
MTVKDLMEILAQLPQDLDVAIHNMDGECAPANEVNVYESCLFIDE